MSQDVSWVPKRKSSKGPFAYVALIVLALAILVGGIEFARWRKSPADSPTLLPAASGLAAQPFPRELRVTADGKTLLITNFASKSLQLVDLARLPLTKR